MIVHNAMFDNINCKLSLLLNILIPYVFSDTKQYPTVIIFCQIYLHLRTN